MQICLALHHFSRRIKTFECQNFQLRLTDPVQKLGKFPFCFKKKISLNSLQILKHFTFQFLTFKNVLKCPDTYKYILYTLLYSDRKLDLILLKLTRSVKFQ